MSITTNTYPTLQAARHAQKYFAGFGFVVRPGEPVETRNGFVVAYSNPMEA